MEHSCLFIESSLGGLSSYTWQEKEQNNFHFNVQILQGGLL